MQNLIFTRIFSLSSQTANGLSLSTKTIEVYSAPLLSRIKLLCERRLPTGMSEKLLTHGDVALKLIIYQRDLFPADFLQFYLKELGPHDFTFRLAGDNIILKLWLTL